jgi:hypothetical protein
LASAKALPGRPLNLTRLLTMREKIAVKTLKVAYSKKYGQTAESNRNLFFYLGDNPSNRKTWSAVSGRLPTLRMSRGKMWNVHLNRWLTGKELLATLGFPVTHEMAEAMSVPPLPVRDPKRASIISGNAMHFSSVAVVQMIALVCFQQLS